MRTANACAHVEEPHLFSSGTSVRAMFVRGEMPSVEFTRPEVAAILAEAYRQGKMLF